MKDKRSNEREYVFFYVFVSVCLRVCIQELSATITLSNGVSPQPTLWLAKSAGATGSIGFLSFYVVSFSLIILRLVYNASLFFLFFLRIVPTEINRFSLSFRTHCPSCFSSCVTFVLIELEGQFCMSSTDSIFRPPAIFPQIFMSLPCCVW